MPSSLLEDDALPLAPGEVLADKYRIERVLGKGGMGFVVAARNINLGKRVAIKMMLPAAVSVPLAVARFEREARAAVQLKSEHVAEVLDIGKLPTGEPYIVMELLEGSDFEALLARERWLSVEDAVDYLLQVCEAVAEAHAIGLVHRDLKPKNLFLSHRLDGTPVVKVLDFGISKWTVSDTDSHSLTRTSDVFGSPNYMSPEQIRSARDVDGRTDIWSLGVILFEMLTGRVPFVAETLPQLCALVLEVKPASVAELRADVPEPVVQIVARCLEKAPLARFPSVRELAAALEPFGRPRPKRASSSSTLLTASSTQLSPSAATIPANALPGSGGLGGSGARVTPPPPPPGAILSSTTGGSWLKVEPERRTSRWLFALLVIPVFAVAGTILGLRGRFTTASPIERDAAVSEAPAASTLVKTASALPPAPPSALPSASASSSASVTALVTPPPRRVVPPAPPPPAARVDAGARVATPPTHTGDPYTPDDRR